MRCALALGLAVLAACGGGPSTEPEPPASPPSPGATLTHLFRYWQFTAFEGPFRSARPLGEIQQDLDVGPVDAHHELGGVRLIPPGEDALARLYVHSSPSGMTYWAGAEAPHTALGQPVAVGGKSQLRQSAYFRKAADDATLEYVVTEVRLLLVDDHTGPIEHRHCSWANPLAADGRDCARVLHAEARFELQAGYVVPGAAGAGREEPLLHVDGRVELFGLRGYWQTGVDHDEAPVWSVGNFEVERDASGTGSGNAARVRLKEPIVVKVPLSDVPRDSRIVVRSTLHAHSFDHLQNGSYAAAYLRDPAGSAGSELRTSGLEPMPVASDEAAPGPVDPTPACSGGPDPLAGTLQFEKADYEEPELPGAGALVTITRGSGSRGAVSVLFETRENTAKAGTDFEPVSRRVRFADGETVRTVRVPIVLDAQAEPTEALGLVLSEPRGCATLGAQASAALHIRDDDGAAPTPAAFRVGGRINGLAGSGLELEDRAQFVSLFPVADGGFVFARDYPVNASYDIRVRTQPANPAQRCSVLDGRGVVTGDVTAVEVQCERTATPTPLDPAFGSGGKASVALPVGKAAAVQPDGRIVIGGGTRLVRLAADGRIDAGFGNAGVVEGLFGGAEDSLHDLALQADGRIVVVGATLPAGAPAPMGYDWAVARFHADGSRDRGFGLDGVVRIDFAATPDRAERVRLQPDGRILVAGTASRLVPPAGDDADFAVVRLLDDGSLDPGFGRDGRAVADFAALDFAYALALQPDGRIVVAGRVSDSRADESDVGVVRFGPDGTLDASFGAGGLARWDLSPNWDEASDLLVQPDGRLVLAVALRNVTRFEFALLRLEADGSRDRAFGVDGLVQTDFGAEDDTERSVLRLPDGSLLVGGQVSSSAVADFGVARFDSGGRIDPSFGGDGVLVVDFFGGADSVYGLLELSDGKVLAIGLTRNGIQTMGGLMRLVP